jgi:hydrogenase 3 maturation protease
MVKIEPSLKMELERWFLKTGNPIRMDDYVGVKIAQDLSKRVSEKVLVIECETVPENSVQQIVEFNPTHVLLIDAGSLGLAPGSFRLIAPERLIDAPAFSTHGLPLRMFCEYIRNTTDAKISLLLIILQ